MRPKQLLGDRSPRGPTCRIFYTPKDGAYADPMQWLHLIREGRFKGQIELTAHSDGRVQLRGYVRSSAAVGYEYLVQSMLRADKQIPAFQRGELIVTKNHRNRFTGAIGDLLESLIKWTAGELVITPGTGLILVTATSVVSLATSGSLIPGARVIDGTLWLAGPSGTLLALAADGLTRLATKEQTLSQADYDFANQVFRGSLPPREKIVVSNSIGAGGRPFTYPRFDGKIVLNLGDHYTDPRGYTTSKRPVPGQLLIHELVHVWQYHNNAAAISYVVDALWARVREDYDPGKVLSEPWDSFGLEEQATIVDKWFEQHHQNLDGPAALQDLPEGQASPHLRGLRAHVSSSRQVPSSGPASRFAASCARPTSGRCEPRASSTCAGTGCRFLPRLSSSSRRGSGPPSSKRSRKS